MTQQVYLSGRLVPREAATLNIYDHGFLYGDGLFEGIRAYSRRVFKLDEHIARCYRSARALDLDLGIEPAAMKKAVLDVVRANNVDTCYIRLTASRGVGLGLDPAHIDRTATVVISTEQLALYPESMYKDGLDVMTVSTRVPPAVCIDPQIKSLGKYVGSIQAKLEANRVGAAEGLMLNMAGHVAEATGDNLFIVRNGGLITPPTSEGALPGITRGAIFQCAKDLDISCVEAVLTQYDCYNADEAFLTGTAAEVIPMTHLDGRTIGTGKAGSVTERLIDAFRARTAYDGAEA